MTPKTRVPLRALIVEHTDADAELVVAELKRAGFDLHADIVATSEAFAARLDAGRYDVVISDYRLPGWTAMDAFALLRQRGDATPLIIVTGTLGDERAVECVKQGVSDYVLKDRLARLPMAVRRALEERRTRSDRAQSEQLIRWLTIAVEQSPAAVLMTDTHGTIQYVNRKFTEITGYTVDEALGKDPRMLQSGETPREEYVRLWTTISAGQEWRGELHNRRKDGSLYWHRASISPIRDASGTVTHYLAVQEDVTEKRGAEELQAATYGIARAAQTAGDLQSLLSAVHEIVGTLMPAQNFYVALYDEASDLLTFPYFVDEKEPPPKPRHSGRGITEQVLRSGKPLLAGEGNPQDVEWVGAHSIEWLGVPLTHGERTIGVLAVQTYSPKVRFTNHHLRLLQFVSTQVAAAIDRKRAEDGLRVSEQRLKTLFETVNLVVLVLNIDGNVDYVNPFLLHLTGYIADEVVGSSWFERFIPEAERPALRGVFRELMEREFHPHHKNVILTKSGEERMISWHNTVLRNAAGDFAGTLSVGEDITEHERLEAQFRQAQKMEAVGRLAGGVAHDFNNVLTAIFGYVELQLDELPEGSPVRTDMLEIRKAAQRAAGLTRQLLAFSRQQVMQPVVLNLNDVIENLDKMLRRLIGEDVELRTALAADLANVRADPGQIEQAIVNLAVNARDAMPQGGKLTVETTNVELSEQYADLHLPVVPGPYVMLAVTDTGTGMTPETKARMFEPFFTTKEKGKGTGLGLATVYGIVKQSGGYIWVYSEPNHGATFKLYFPRVDAPVEAAVPSPELKGTLAGTETVLLAEDDELLRPLAKTLLDKLGYTVLDAADAAEAMAKATSHRGPIHLLITDVVMPGVSGRELARQLVAVRPDTRVLFVSGYTDDAIVRHGLLEPGLHYMQKPFTPASLARKVREVLGSK